MICLWCRDQAHRMCRGGTWCDCQHRISTRWAELVQKYTAQIMDPVTALAWAAELRQSATIMSPAAGNEYRRLADEVEGDGTRL